MGIALLYLGLAVSFGGMALIFGNMTGLYPTFPFAGFLVTTLGGLLAAVGNSLVESEDSASMSDVQQFLKDPRYTAAVSMAVEEAEREGATSSSILERPTQYLIDNGVNSNVAGQNLSKVLAVYVAAAKKEERD